MLEKLHHGCKPYVVITEWHSSRDDCSHWGVWFNMLGTFWSQNISKTVILIGLKEQTSCCSLRALCDLIPQYWHALYVEVLWLWWCSVVGCFDRQEDVATPSCLFMLKRVNTAYGETAERLWRAAWPKPSEAELTRSVEPAENLRTLNQVLCWTTEVPVKGVAPAPCFCRARRLPHSVHVCSFMFI